MQLVGQLFELFAFFESEAKRLLDISHTAIEKSRAAQAGELGRLPGGLFQRVGRA